MTWGELPLEWRGENFRWNDVDPSVVDLLPQVPPGRICRLDQRDLPGPEPGLQQFLPPDRVVDRVMPFGEDQPVQPVFAAEGRALPGAMLADPRGKVGGDADVEDAAHMIGHD